MSIASLILGIASVILSFFNLALWWLCLPVGIAGIVLGILGKKQDLQNGKATGMATAGMVLSIVGVALCLVLTIACLACYGCAEEAVEESIRYGY